MRITFTSSCKMACDLEESELTPVAPVLRTPPPYSITCKETTSSVIKQVLKFIMILEMTFQVSICSVKAQKHPVMEFVIIIIIIIPPSILLHCEHAAQSIQLCTLGDWHLLLQITCKTYRKYVIRLLSKAVFCFANVSTSAAY